MLTVLALSFLQNRRMTEVSVPKIPQTRWWLTALALSFLLTRRMTEVLVPKFLRTRLWLLVLGRVKNRHHLDKLQYQLVKPISCEGHCNGMRCVRHYTG
jgi:hypothetical protein